MGSKDYHEVHSRLYDGMSRFFSSKNAVMMYKNGRRRSLANAESWSNLLTRYGRFLHSASLLHSSKLDFWKDTCNGKPSECSKQSARIFQTHYDCVRAECSRLASVTAYVTKHWKRPRRESLGQSCTGIMRMRATRAMTTPGESSTNPGNLGELAERLGNFHESARALADCLHTRDITRQRDPSTIKAARHMYHKLLEKASDDLERMTPCRGHTGQTTMSSSRDIE